MKIKSRIYIYYASIYAKKIGVSLFLLLILAWLSILMISKFPNSEDIEVSEIIGNMISFHPKEDNFGTSFLIQVELETGVISSFHSDQFGVYQKGRSVLLRQVKNLKNGEVTHSFIQRTTLSLNKENQSRP